MKAIAMHQSSIHTIPMAPNPKIPPSLTKCDLIREKTGFAILGLVRAKPNTSITKLSEAIGVSDGMAYYLPRNLIAKRYVRFKNFSKNPNKCNYTCILTQAILPEKLKLTSVFLEWKLKEYYVLQKQISVLERNFELSSGSQNE